MRITPATANTYIDKLDRSTAPPRLELRSAERFAYRQPPLTARFELQQTPTPTSVFPRNISRTGVGLLADRFLYPSTRCEVDLLARDGVTHATVARVVRCRYILGSGALYETGLQFDQPIDVSLFSDDAHRLQIALLTNSPELRNLLTGLFDVLRADLLPESDPATLAADLLETEPELLLLDLDGNASDRLAFALQLRRAGYLGAIVGLSLSTAEKVCSESTRAGLTGLLLKPVTRANLAGLLDSLRAAPLLSTLGHDPALAPLVNRFVATLRPRARRLSIALIEGNLAALRQSALDLRADGGSYGFDPITEEAEHLQALLALNVPRKRLQAAVSDLIHVCLAARPMPTSDDALSQALDGALFP